MAALLRPPHLAAGGGGRRGRRERHTPATEGDGGVRPGGGGSGTDQTRTHSIQTRDTAFDNYTGWYWKMKDILEMSFLIAGQEKKHRHV